MHCLSCIFSPGGSTALLSGVNGFRQSRCGPPSQQLHDLQVIALQDSALPVAAASRPSSTHFFPSAPPCTQRHAAHSAGPGLPFRWHLAGPGLATRPCLGSSRPTHQTVPSNFSELCQFAGFFGSATYKLICSSETVAAFYLQLSFLFYAFFLVAVDNHIYDCHHHMNCR